MLLMSEQVLLLSLDDETGAVESGVVAQHYGLASAVLMDLVLAGRIATEGENVVVRDQRPVGEEVLDDVLRLLCASDVQPLAHWVRTITGRGEIVEALRNRLIASGILEKVEKKFLWIIKTNRFPMIDGQAEANIRNRIQAILMDSQPPNERETLLLGIIKACGLDRVILGPDGQRKCAARLDELTSENQVNQTVAALLSQDAAVMMAVMIATSF